MAKTHVYTVLGWSVTLPVVGSTRRFVGYVGGPVGRAFFPTRKEARACVQRNRSVLGLHGRVVRATLTLKAFD